jgi:hypothetical protein
MSSDQGVSSQKVSWYLENGFVQRDMPYTGHSVSAPAWADTSFYTVCV